MDESGSSGEVKWTLSFSAELPKMDAAPKYSRISEHFRHVTPGVIQCSMFCGGKQCKYENPSRMKTDEMAINGLYSSWVTPQILATARPSTEVIKTYDVIQQFTSTGIRSLINLQHPGEHASCGFGLEPESGFSYVPEHFMQEDIYFYNFGWNDYGVRSLESILDMVKVMSFALTKGKAAVHCHAGLGRTGVLIACYLVFSERAEAEEAIHRVRSNRPKAVQTRGQIQCVIDFTNFLHHLWVVFPSCAPGAKMFTLQQYLKRQRHLLHGLESRHLKHIPKVVYLCCCRLLEVAGVKRENTPLTMTLFREVKAVFAEADDNDVTNEPTGNSIQPSIAEDIVKALRHNPYVDSSVSSLDTAIIQHTQSWETVEGQNVELRGENQLEIGLLKPTNSTVHGRRASDFQVSYSGNTRSSDHKLILPLGHKEKLEPMNPANREPDKKKKGKGKNRRRMDAESSFANTVDKRVAENSFCNSLKQNAAQSATNERIQVAKCLASSACADSGVHNRVERIKRKLNSSDCWEEVHSESDPWILTRLLWNWLAELAEPALTEKEVSLLEESIDDPIRAVKQLGRGERETLECLITTICELEPLPKELSDRVLRHTAMVLTHNMDLSLTQTRKQTDRACTPSQSPRQSTADGGREFAEPSDSVLCSSSYRLVCFLRLLVEALKRLGGLS